MIWWVLYHWHRSRRNLARASGLYLLGTAEPNPFSQSPNSAPALKAAGIGRLIFNTSSLSERETRRAHKRMPMGRRVRCQVGPDGPRIQASWGVRHALHQLTQARPPCEARRRTRYMRRGGSYVCMPDACRCVAVACSVRFRISSSGSHALSCAICGCERVRSDASYG